MESILPDGSQNAMVVELQLILLQWIVFINLKVLLISTVLMILILLRRTLSLKLILFLITTFSSRVLTDFFESVGNRVLSIDDVSGSFNSNPRPTAFSIANTFDLDDVRAQKYITYVKDRRFVGQRQLMIVDLIHDRSFGYMNQYGRVETTYDQGSFDFRR